MIEENQVSPPASVARAQAIALAAARQEWTEWPIHASKGRPTWEPIVLRYISDGCMESRDEIGKYEWCGAFAAYCYRMTIAPKIRKHIFPSTYRLWLWGKHKRDKNLWPYARVKLPSGEIRLLSDVYLERGGGPIWMPGRSADGLVDVRAGDIVLVRGEEGKPSWAYGGHVTLATSGLVAGKVETLSGNTLGKGSDGKDRKIGLVAYDVEDIAGAIRPSLVDMDWSLEYLP